MAYDVDQFAELIKAKHPGYADMPNNELTQKIVSKFPQYADMVDMPISTAMPSTGSAQTQPAGFKPDRVEGDRPGKLDVVDIKQGLTGVKEAFGGIKERVVDITKEEAFKGAEKIQEAGEKFKAGEPIEATAKLITGGIKTGLSPLAGIFGGIAQPGIEDLASGGASVIKEGLIKRLGDEGGEQAFDQMKQNFSQTISGLQEEYEALPSNAKTAVDLGLALFELGTTIEGGRLVVKPATEIVEAGIEAVPRVIKAGGEVVAEKVPAVVSGAKGLVEAGIQKGVGAAQDLVTATKQAIDSAKTVIDERQILKTTNEINSRVDTFINSKKSLLNKTDELGRQGVDVQKHLKDPEIFAGLRVEGGKLDPSEAIDVIEGRISAALKAKREILPIVDELVTPVTKEQIRERAMASMKELTPAQQTKLVDKINKEIDALPDSMSISELDNLRARARQSSRDAKGALKSDSEFAALEKAARDLVFEATDNLPIDTNGAFANLNQYVRELIAVQGFLDKGAKGIIVDSGRMTKLFDKTYGAIAGSSLGPLGAIAGAEVSGVISNVLANNQLGNTVKRNIIIKMLGEGPEAIRMADDLLKRAKEFELPALPGGKEGARTEVRQPGVTELPKESPSAIEAREIERLGKTQSATTKTTFIKEAKKFKTADDFVNSQRKLFRGSTNVARDERTIKGVLSTSENPDIAKIFSGENGKVEEFFLDPSAKIIKLKDATDEVLKIKNQSNIRPIDFINYAKENGFDAIDMKSLKLNIQSSTNPKLKGFEDEIKILNKKVLKTKAQLEEIFNSKD